ncbi:ImpE [Burkholderia humptydooensis]|uniref:ImpE n=2 Tax=Burkholderia humptydooensis TaxID=430531 RepID=A0A7U4P8H6_9BURK|nr:impE family protein [Burkholderia sp. 2002721687]ALX44862.1 ImpE [Burkholderia humptydooensis]EIP84522.1 ImpE/SciE family protein [Burkholderia humptydooensis MSMB43]QPS46313.1 ImpE [Burkholderia humptydooensis]
MTTPISPDASGARATGRLQDRPLVVWRAPHASFDWIADSDSRFGPVREVVTAGHYRWLPLSDLAGWRLARPGTLLDLVELDACAFGERARAGEAMGGATGGAAHRARGGEDSDGRA